MTSQSKIETAYAETCESFFFPFPPWPYDAFLTVIKGISVCVIDS